MIQHSEISKDKEGDMERNKDTHPRRHPLTSSLLKAAYEGDLNRVRTFLKEGVPVDACNSAGLRALHFVAKSGQAEVAAELVKRGANVNAVSLKGHSPLHVACLLGHKDVVKVLLQEKAQVNAKSKCHDDDFTPLYMAAQIGDQEIVSLLLAHGADPTLTTKNGCTAKDVANQQGFSCLAQLLQECEKRYEELKTPTNQASTPCVHSSTPSVNTPSDQLPMNQLRSSSLRSVHRTPYKHLAKRLLQNNLPPSIFQADIIRSPGNYPSPIRPPAYTPSSLTMNQKKHTENV